MSLPGWRTSANQRRRIAEAEQRRLQPPTPEIQDVNTVRRREERYVPAPDPVSNVLGDWILQRARERNARADQLIQEIDGYLANPITLNRWHFDENFSLFSLEQQADGNWVSTRPNFHESLRSRTRAGLIENGLNMNDIALLRQMALRPAPAEQAIDNPNDLYDPVTESDVEF